MDNIPRNPQAEAAVNQDILQALAQGEAERDMQQQAQLNGWDSPGVVPDAWVQKPGRPTPQGPGSNVRYQGPQAPPPDFDQIRRENAELRERLSQAEAAVSARNLDQTIADAVKNVKLPEGWANLSLEQQEQIRAKSLLEALKPMIGAPRQEAPTHLEDRLDEMDMRVRFRDLSPEQVAALRDIKKTRKPQSDQELMALAAVAHPGLFPPRQQATGYVAPPGREMPDRQAKPGFVDLARATQESRGVGTRTYRDRLGAAALRALADEDPQLFSQGR